MALRLVLCGPSGSTRLALQLLRELHRQLDDVERLPFGAIVLTGVPGSFCEGMDVEGPEAQAAVDEGLAALASLLDRLERVGRPVIALVDGAALGGGLGLAAVADLVLATSRASFGLPESLLGLLPAVVFPFVARRIGVARGRLLALGGKPLDALEALQAGLVDEVTPDLEVSLRRHAGRLERADPRAVEAVKGLVADHYSAPHGYRAEAVAAFRFLLDSGPTRARLRRFVEGGAPWDEGDR